MLIDININPLDTINPDQDIAPTFEYVISKAHGNVPPADKPLANVHSADSVCTAQLGWNSIVKVDVTSTGARDNNHRENPLGHRQGILLPCKVGREVPDCGKQSRTLRNLRKQPHCCGTPNRKSDHCDCYQQLARSVPPCRLCKGCRGVEHAMDTYGMPTEVTLQQALHTNNVKETRLLHCPEDIIYTDGSKS